MSGQRQEQSRERREGGVAYLVSHYPSVSHAFIEREVTAVRDQGVTVHTFSVRPSRPEDQLSENARAEARTTRNLLGRPAVDYLRAQARLAVRHPLAWASVGLRAVTSGPRSLRGKVWQVFYLAEAAVMVEDLRALGVTHVHVHFANNGADVARLVVAIGRAVDGPGAGWHWSLSMHGPTEFFDPEGHDLAAKVRSADAIACISLFCRDALLSLQPDPTGDLAAKMHLVRMSVDAQHYPSAGELRAQRVAGDLRILFVGRLVPEKGPDVLVEAVRLLATGGTAVEVRIVGEGPLRGELQRLVSRAGLDDRVHLLGAVGQDELPDLYEWADVFCLPSFAEGVPAVLMEAMSSELPVVTTRIAGIPELVGDGVEGLLVEPGRPEELAEALRGLAGGAGWRSELGAAGRRRVLEEFAAGLNSRRLIDVWRGEAVPQVLVEGRELDASSEEEVASL